MFSYRTTIVFACALAMPPAMLADSSSAAAKVQIFKCLSATGKLSFQKSPCPATDRAQSIYVAGDSAANKDAAANLAAQAAVDRAQQEYQSRLLNMQSAYLEAQAQAQAKADAANKARKPPVVCPPTFGDEVTMAAPTTSYYDASGRPHTVVQDMSVQYRFLPTKTYLKNAGRWPKECPQ